jgi:endonuclease-3 related protein
MSLPWPAPLAVHRRLLRAYGPQGWWPVTPAGADRPRYRPGFSGRLAPRQRLEVCVGAILTQNTNWGNVEKAMSRLHEAGIRDLGGLLAVSQPRMEGLIRSSGYFRQKAKKLKAFARRLADRGGKVGAWLSGDLESCRAELLGLYGIGPETADSILLYAAGRPSFVIDAYTLRIGKRLGWFKKPSYDQARTYLTRRLPNDAGLYNEFHALLVRLAKVRCRKAGPLCAGCPLQEVCRYGPNR